MKKQILFAVLGFAMSSQQAFASKAIITALEPLEAEKYGLSIGMTKVRGSTAAELLKDYAERTEGFEDGYTLSLRLAAKDFPEADDGRSVVGLARIIDVLDFLIDPAMSFEGTKEERQEREAFVRDLLFQVRDLGGLIGVESDNWSTCGVSFPGVIILDVKAKEVISISPANTDC